MKKHTLRLIFALVAVAFLSVVTGCHSDGEVERTKLPSIDSPEKKTEKSK